MPRGGYNGQPKKISFFVDEFDTWYGPYAKKPTARFKDEVGHWREYHLDDNGNYTLKRSDKDKIDDYMNQLK